MSDNLFLNSEITKVAIDSEDFVITTENTKIWFALTNPIDFKNQVLWAYEKYLRERKEKANDRK